MSIPEQTPKSPAAKTGFFAMLAGLLRRRGTGAPSRHPKLLLALAGAALLATLVLGVSLASGAAPTVTIEGASAVRYTTATAKGEVDPADHETSYHFEYATEADFSNAESAGFGSLAEGAGLSPVEAQLAGLRPNTTYHLRLRAENSEGEVSEAEALTFTTEAVAKPSVSIAAPTAVTSSGAHLSGHINPNAPEAAPTGAVVEAAFETHWHFQCSPECPELEGTLAADNTAHEVTAAATGLLPGTSYEVHLIAANAGGQEESAAETFTTPAIPPTVSSPAATGISATEAILSAQVNPGGAPTTYHFEYLTDAQFQSEGGFSSPAEISTSETPIGADDEAHEAEATVTGLIPGTTYHFRIAATNTSPGNPVVTTADRTFIAFAGVQSQPQSCPNETLRTGPSAALPDCRAYELVSPPFKNGEFVSGQIFNGAGVTSPLDGSHLFFTSLGAFNGAGANTGADGAHYVAARAGSGWASTPLDPSDGDVSSFDGLREPFQDVSSDFTRSLFLETPSSGPQNDQRFYLSQPGGAFSEVGPLESPAVVPLHELTGDVIAYKGASADLSHVLFVLNNGGHPNNIFWPGDSTVPDLNADSLYEYAGTGNSAPTLVGLDNSGDQISQCGTQLGSADPFAGTANNAVSTDGSTVFFTAGGITHDFGAGSCDTLDPSAVAPPADELFARLDATGPSPHTVSISEPSAADCSACDISAPADALYQGASRNGSRAFFLTSQALLGSDTSQNLYSYDFNGPTGQKLTRVSAGDPAAADVQGVARISADGSHVYFVAQGVLTTDPNAQAQTAQPGDHNLYLYDAATATTSFIAPLSGGDSADWRLSDGNRPVQATPDGRFLLFRSNNDLTPDASGTGQQFYRYDSQTAALDRITIGEAGFNDNGNNSADVPVLPASNHSTSFADTQPVSISDDGAYVFFQTPAALTPGALNDQPIDQNGALANNVYEYHSGHVYLLSGGQDTGEVFGNSSTKLLGADHSGSDVYLLSASPLASQDGDTGQDAYDLRIDGGLPPESVPTCSGDACQPASSPPPDQTPGSAGSNGPGNQPQPKPCPKGKVRKHGKCVKKHSGKKHHTKAHKRHPKSNRGASK